MKAATVFVLAILSLVIISIVALIVIEDMRQAEGGTTHGGTLSNASMDITFDSIDDVGYPDPLTAGMPDCEFTISGAQFPNGSIIHLDNFSIDGCAISPAFDPDTGMNNTLWNVNGTYTNSSDSSLIVYNTSASLSEFFTNTTTWFGLLAVVIIILIISVVIIVVNRFGGGPTGSGNDLTSPSGGPGNGSDGGDFMRFSKA